MEFQIANIISFILRYYAYRTYLGIFVENKNLSQPSKICSFIIYFVIASYMPNLGILGNFIMLAVTNSFYALWICNGKKLAIILLAVLYNFMSFSCEFVIAFVIQYINNKDTNSYFILGMLLTWCLLLVVTLFLKKILKPQRNRNVNRRQWFILILLAASGTLVNICMNITYSHSNVESDGYLAILVALLMVTITIIIYKVYENLTEQADLELKNVIYQQQADIYRYQISQREHTMKEFQRMRHDIRNHLIFVKELLAKEDINEADKYIDGLLSNESLTPTNISKSGNLMIDGLINYKASFIQELGIEFITKISIPQKMNIPDENLCVVLGNLLDNAIEGASQEKEGEHSINLKIQFEQNILHILISNTYDSSSIKQNGSGFLTSKQNGAQNHGIGLSSVKRAAEECDGSIKITLDEKFFTVSVLMTESKIKKM